MKKKYMIDWIGGTIVSLLSLGMIFVLAAHQDKISSVMDNVSTVMQNNPVDEDVLLEEDNDYLWYDGLNEGWI